MCIETGSSSRRFCKPCPSTSGAHSGRRGDLGRLAIRGASLSRWRRSAHRIGSRRSACRPAASDPRRRQRAAFSRVRRPSSFRLLQRWHVDGLGEPRPVNGPFNPDALNERRPAEARPGSNTVHGSPQGARSYGRPGTDVMEFDERGSARTAGWLRSARLARPGHDIAVRPDGRPSGDDRSSCRTQAGAVDRWRGRSLRKLHRTYSYSHLAAPSERLSSGH